MKKSMYILEVLVVVLMVITFISNVFTRGFGSEEFLIFTTAILLSVIFYDDYKKDKIITQLQKNSNPEIENSLK